ncbi:uncharacterized protein V1510DRAFT_428658 [Dipodascopsis tothii]|uniref:uncharacterized protein n=1 Tax=Dipodascopsis tothii TaxID=44089 RepID=UPI0034CEEF81
MNLSQSFPMPSPTDPWGVPSTPEAAASTPEPTAPPLDDLDAAGHESLFGLGPFDARACDEPARTPSPDGARAALLALASSPPVRRRDRYAPSSPDELYDGGYGRYRRRAVSYADLDDVADELAALDRARAIESAHAGTVAQIVSSYGSGSECESENEADARRGLLDAAALRPYAAFERGSGSSDGYSSDAAFDGLARFEQHLRACGADAGYAHIPSAAPSTRSSSPAGRSADERPGRRPAPDDGRSPRPAQRPRLRYSSSAESLDTTTARRDTRENARRSPRKIPAGKAGTVGGLAVRPDQAAGPAPFAPFSAPFKGYGPATDMSVRPRAEPRRASRRWRESAANGALSKIVESSVGLLALPRDGYGSVEDYVASRWHVSFLLGCLAVLGGTLFVAVCSWMRADGRSGDGLHAAVYGCAETTADYPAAMACVVGFRLPTFPFSALDTSSAYLHVPMLSQLYVYAAVASFAFAPVAVLAVLAAVTAFGGALLACMLATKHTATALARTSRRLAVAHAAAAAEIHAAIKGQQLEAE